MPLMGFQMSSFGIIAVQPAHRQESFANPAIAIAAARAGAFGVVDVEFLDDAAAFAAVQSLTAAAVAASVNSGIGIKCGAEQFRRLAEQLDTLALPESTLIILTAGAPQFERVDLQAAVKLVRACGWLPFVEVTSLKEARLAETAGCDALIAKGHEAGGRVGEETTFVLLQRLAQEVKVPFWAHGGVGVHTAAACRTAGAQGVVLDWQLALVRESTLPLPLKVKLSRMDGTESQIFTGPQRQTWRIYARAGSTAHDALQDLTKKLDVQGSKPLSEEAKSLGWLAAIKQELTADDDINGKDFVLAAGQDVAFASSFADRFGTTAGVIDGLRDAVEEHLTQSTQVEIVGADSPLARSHKTKYPIVQGAMTRVSDTAEFALKVAEGGALPFLALALMRAREIEKLIKETKEALGDLPWGVGMLGFVPQQLRQEQMEVIERYKPPFALIAGGRPDQAKAMEDGGITTYLHVPSPLLLKSFVEMGSRRFIFEGKECGGHVGPRSSFVLWESMVDVLLSSIAPREDAGAYHVLFAGGIHDGLSAAMVATLSAPLAARGVKVGVLVGTAYLFTQEAVDAGAIVKRFQEAAIQCDETVLLETGPGHSIRCIDSPYKSIFDEQRRSLESQSKGREEIRQELEMMNLGRLRIASKGLSRAQGKTTADGLISINDDEQWASGMYMIGQVAAMHDRVITIAELHEEIAAGGKQILDKQVRSITVSVNDAQKSRKPSEPIAIIGMSCMFPKANDVETYWQNILNKVDAIEEVPEYQWDWRNYYTTDPLDKDRVISKWGGFLEDVVFDPSKYGIPPSSLASIDPMQVLLLEITQAALADAGYSKRGFARQKTSVLLANAGHGPITALYSLRSMLGWKLHDMDETTKKYIESQLPEWSEDSFPGYLGNVTAGRVANRFDLGGINFAVDAACASSLAALYVGINELRAGTSDVVLLGATDTHNQPGDYLSFSNTHALSPGGRCRTFDATADGIVISEGIAMLVLKRLSDAERDGDKIYAVIKGIGGSSDGRDLSLTAPRPAGQMVALNRAYEDAGLSPSTVELVEAHGTGTVAGDRAEVEALTRVFRAHDAADRACAIGSVKTNIGHSKCAAGLASLIKIAKSLHHKVLPPTIGVQQPNPSCHFEESPFYINSEARPWVHTAEQPRRAGVSAFGFGGTNFHTVLEEYTGQPAGEPETVSETLPTELFVWRANTKADLSKALHAAQEAAKKLVAQQSDSARSQCTSDDARALADLSYNLYTRASERSDAALTMAIVAQSAADLETKAALAAAKLDEGVASINDPRGIFFVEKPLAPAGKIAFLFPGQGSQRVDMLRQLSLYFPEIRDTFTAADKQLAKCYEAPLSNYVYPAPAFSDEVRKQQQTALTDTHVAQPAVGAADLAVFHLLAAFGIAPDMVAGHSYGEYVAFYAAGSVSQQDLFDVSERRGRLLARPVDGETGTMAAVAASADKVKAALKSHPGVVIANINAPSQTIISGTHADIKDACEALTREGVANKPIAVSAAFHSPLMQAARAELETALKKIEFREPKLPVYSNTTTRPHEGKFASSLAQHLVEPVNFVGEVQRMHDDGARIFIEVGPGQVLTGLVSAILEDREHVAVASDRNGKHGITQLQHVLAQLLVHGVRADLSRLFSRPGMATRALEADFERQPKAARGKLIYRVNSAQIKRIGTPSTQQAVSATFKKIQGATTGTMDNGANGNNGGNGKASGHVNMQPISGTISEPFGGNGNGNGNGHGNGHGNGNGNGNGHGHGQHAPLPAQPLVQATANALPKPPTPVSAMQPQAAPIGRPLPASPAVPAQQGAPQGVPAPTAYALPTAVPMPVLPAAGRAGIDPASAAVMMQFQQTMLQMTQSFLETQQRVMLAYLGAQPQGYAPQMPQFPQPQFQQFQQPLPMQQFAQPQQYAQPQFPQYAQPQQYAQPLPQPAVAPSSADSNGHDPSGYAASGNGSTAHAHNNGNNGGEPANEAADQCMNAEQLIAGLLEIVSQRTGYPPEMLDPALDLEADLGIDSIKRVEILNSFRKLLPQSTQDHLEGSLEQLAGTKTLQGIIDWIKSENIGGGGPAAQATAATDATAAAGTVSSPINSSNVASTEAGPTLAKEVSRGQVQLIAVPLEGKPAKITSAIVIGDGKGLSEKVSSKLKTEGASVTLLKSEDFASAETLQKKLIGVKAPIDAIVHLSALDVDGDDVEKSAQAVRSLFLLGKALHPHFSGSKQRVAVVSAVDLGGAFGFDGVKESPSTLPVSAGVVGLTKTFKKEWAHLQVRCVDFQSAVKPAQRAELILTELTHDCDVVEIAYQGEQRLGLEIVAVPVDTKLTSGMKLDKSSVILITGGARGITAEIAVELAEKYQPQIILVGRLPKPVDEEDASTAPFQTAREVKAAIMEKLKAQGKPVSVAGVETIYQQLMREREVRNNLARIRKAGASVMYNSVDVRDQKAFTEFIGNLYESFGNIDGVVHGAGIIEDAYIKDKTVESFDRVFFTKVNSAFSLASALRFDTLKFLTFFSSIVGRTGNAGQSDYVSANEVLNKLAQQLNQTTDARVTSLLWGPWKAGMAQPELEEIFARYGWAMIEVGDGRRSFIEELQHGKKSDAEVMLVGKLSGTGGGSGGELLDASSVKAAGARLGQAQVRRAQPGEAEFEVTLSTGEDRYLDDHKFDGVPVLPMAFALELMSEAAIATFPGMTLRRITEMDIPSGLVFDTATKKMVVKVTAESHANQVVLARVSVSNASGKVHFKSLIELGASASQTSGTTVTGATTSVPVAFQAPTLEQAEATPPTVKHIYTNYMFHGPAFQGITGLSALGIDGIVGSLAPSAPAECLQTPGATEWVIDPILFDSAMQLAGVWARHYLDITVLPTGFKALHYFKAPLGTTFTGRVFIPPDTGKTELLCDLAIYNEQNQLVMVVEGLGGIGNKSLNRFASQPKALRSGSSQ